MIAKTASQHSRTRSRVPLVPAGPDPSGIPMMVVPPSQQCGTKLERISALLRRHKGAGLAELGAVTSWQEHSLRGSLAGSVKRKRHVVLSERVDGIRRYRIEVSP